MNRSTLHAVAVMSGALWAIALVVPAFRIEAGWFSGPYPGIVVALVGPLAITQGIFSWYANAYWLYATIRMSAGHAPNFYLAGANSLLAGSFLMGFSFGSSNGSTPLVGAWLWLLSFAPGVIVAMAAALRPNRQDAQD